MAESMDLVFKALADRNRRRMLDIIKKKPGCNVGDVAAYFKMSRIGVMTHLKVLDQAKLVHSEKAGRSRQLYINPVPIQIIYDRWTSEFSGLWAEKLTRFKYSLEREGADDGGKA